MPLSGLEPLLATMAIALAGATVQTVTGFGFALLAVPSLVLVLPVREAIVVASLLGLGNASLVALSTRGHADRGTCTDCHRIVSREGERLPAITTLSSMPHEFRGVCNNCHLLEPSWLLTRLPAAAMPNPARPNTAVGSLVARGLAW